MYPCDSRAYFLGYNKEADSLQQGILMQERKSFIIHKDSLSVLDELTDAQAGQLFKAIKSYQTEQDYELDNVLRIAFASFKNQFIRDAEKYAETVERRREAGSKGGQAKQQNLANASNSKQNLANLADSVSKSDSKKDSDKESKKNILIPSGINLNSWNEWIEFRKSKKKPVSQLAANKVFKWLVNYSPQEQQDIVNKSITNDYQGLFEPKVQHENSQRNNSEYVDNSAAGRVRAEVAKLRASIGGVADDVIDVRPQMGIELWHES